MNVQRANATKDKWYHVKLGHQLIPKIENEPEGKAHTFIKCRQCDVSQSGGMIS